MPDEHHVAGRCCITSRDGQHRASMISSPAGKRCRPPLPVAQNGTPSGKKPTWLETQTVRTVCAGKCQTVSRLRHRRWRAAAWWCHPWPRCVGCSSLERRSDSAGFLCSPASCLTPELGRTLICFKPAGPFGVEAIVKACFAAIARLPLGLGLGLLKAAKELSPSRATAAGKRIRTQGHAATHGPTCHSRPTKAMNPSIAKRTVQALGCGVGSQNVRQLALRHQPWLQRRVESKRHAARFPSLQAGFTWRALERQQIRDQLLFQALLWWPGKAAKALLVASSPAGMRTASSELSEDRRARPWALCLGSFGISRCSRDADWDMRR